MLCVLLLFKNLINKFPLDIIVIQIITINKIKFMRNIINISLPNTMVKIVKKEIK